MEDRQQTDDKNKKKEPEVDPQYKPWKAWMGEEQGANAADQELEEEEETDSFDSLEDEIDETWIQWYCGLRGNEFFCEVAESYVQDDFNLTGLSAMVPYYDHALDVIMDVDTFSDEALTLSSDQNEIAQTAAEVLYGLIHARYILTRTGMMFMEDKFENGDFGQCPRIFCQNQDLLPVGQSDIPRTSTVKVFCPKCEDMYHPRSSRQGTLDGAYFGTTFPHLFLMTYPNQVPSKPMQSYVPRVFGFRVTQEAHDKLYNDAKMREAMKDVAANPPKHPTPPAPKK